MQTSFMHPPFGFALFYLRGIADTLFKNGALPKKVESRDIYLGAVPWVVMQLLLVAIVIFFPQTVTVFLEKEKVVDIEKVNLDMPVDPNAPPATDNGVNMEDPFGNQKTPEETPAPAAPAAGEASKP
ncbi:Tripartite ATP-independent periplasmic transporter, DctM component [compost metagenome]